MLRRLPIILVVIGIVTTLLTTVPPLQIQVQASTIGGCPEGFIPATPPLNPQLGCVPDTITSDPGGQPGPGIPPGACPEGSSPATPPLNPQLGCLPDSITADPGVQPGGDEREVQGESADDETTDGAKGDVGSTLSAVPADRVPSDGEDEGGGEGNEENGSERGANDDVVQ
ncbi:MAG: hypothetical protein ACRD5J_02440 [Nitrososphaeraceae archaeon]